MSNEEQHRLNVIAHERLEETLNRIDTRVEKISDTIHGNGQPGLKTVVDRHEQTLGIFKRFFWILVTGVVTLAGGVVLAAIL
jgi:hypothetical protein